MIAAVSYLLPVVFAAAAVAPPDPAPESARRPVPPAYDLSLAVDGPVLASSAVLFGGALVAEHISTPATVPGDPAHLWRVDRLAIDLRSPASNTTSTVLQDSLVIGMPLALALSEWDGTPHGLTPAIVVAESILASSALNQLAKSLVHRPRPYAYSLRDASGDARRSFYSGHTTVSFAAVTSGTLVLRTLYPASPVPTVVGAFGVAAATTVGVLRVASGMHFPTDVAVGALTGIGIGWLVPALHRRAVGDASWSLNVGPAGLTVSGSL